MMVRGSSGAQTGLRRGWWMVRSCGSGYKNKTAISLEEAAQFAAHIGLPVH